ncbi:MAG TPA: AAA family ATPase [Stellaceae bacterium]|nr:AAA family ATPase [Stellaceae bacterium]
MSDEQQEIIAFLSDPSSYGAGVSHVDTIETHASLVFLAGDRAYKLKRAIKYPYLDFSTEPLRRKACEAELDLNRRTAPEIYLELRSICRSAKGALGWGPGSGAVDCVMDWVVIMRRFEQGQLLEAIAAAGRLDARLILALAAHIADFHDKAEPRPDHGGSTAIADIVLANWHCLQESRRVAFDAGVVAELRQRSLRQVAQLRQLLDARREAGRVRRCHGDLHLRNICVLDGRPVLFDCLEFDESLASIDVLYDLAFLVMDFCHRGHLEFANLLLNRYLDLTNDDDGLPALPLFLSLRAAIRAHVTATALDHARAEGVDTGAESESRRYLDEACSVLRPQPRRLVAIGGLSGTGKSTLAARLAPEIGTSPGARVLRSDVIRKRLFGSDPEAPLPESAYRRDVSARVYGEIRAKAASILGSGYSVIIDAVALNPDERQSFAAVAGMAKVPFTGLWLEARTEVMVERVRARHDDASDATAEVVGQQLRSDPGAMDWQRVDADSSPAATLAAARKCLGLG